MTIDEALDLLRMAEQAIDDLVLEIECFEIDGDRRELLKSSNDAGQVSDQIYLALVKHER